MDGGGKTMNVHLLSWNETVHLFAHDIVNDGYNRIKFDLLRVAGENGEQFLLYNEPAEILNG